MARRAARRWASAMPSSSHSPWLAAPTAQATHQAATRSKSRSRSTSVSILESRTRYTRRSRGQHRGADHERSGPRTAADLVDADHDVMAGGPGRPLKGQGGGGSGHEAYGSRPPRMRRRIAGRPQAERHRRETAALSSGQVYRRGPRADGANFHEPGVLQPAHNPRGDGGQEAPRRLRIVGEGLERLALGPGNRHVDRPLRAARLRASPPVRTPADAAAMAPS